MRYYQWTDQELKQNESQINYSTSDQICRKILLPKELKPESNSTWVISISVSGSLIILILIIMVAIFIINKRRSRLTRENTSVYDSVYYSRDKNVVYEEYMGNQYTPVIEPNVAGYIDMRADNI